ncbi:hypothetical protein L0657_24405 [Dyadobacter sp. CY345]|uniref:hypothetical protein n=1 Tax=Dyadobacter sp. CY345 TaxID=2909335 RepID=UPI001F364A9C|nr:hypothetical protein [Dyadobacter sp. CY345]MCF2447119.1 hypothetical protein [Dyadobacter sp. CY345]
MTQVSKHKRKSALLNLRNSFKSLLLSNSRSVEKNAKSDEISENRFSVLYKYKSQYHHIGCSSQSQAQSTLGMLMTDGDRIPVGIYDAKTDLFEWEIVGQYFHSQDPISEQSRRLDEVLNIARALRRRDSSWQPGYLQRPSFFA